MLLGKILHLATVFVQVVEFPRLISRHDSLPSVFKNGVIPLIAPPKRFVVSCWLGFEEGAQGLSGQVGGIRLRLRAGEIKEGREDVDDVGRGVAEFWIFGDPFRPLMTSRRTCCG